MYQTVHRDMGLARKASLQPHWWICVLSRFYHQAWLFCGGWGGSYNESGGHGASGSCIKRGKEQNWSIWAPDFGAIAPHLLAHLRVEPEGGYWGQVSCAAAGVEGGEVDEKKKTLAPCDRLELGGVFPFLRLIERERPLRVRRSFSFSLHIILFIHRSKTVTRHVGHQNKLEAYFFLWRCMPYIIC
jgi:hypothetical protein